MIPLRTSQIAAPTVMPALSVLGLYAAAPMPVPMSVRMTCAPRAATAPAKIALQLTGFQNPARSSLITVMLSSEGFESMVRPFLGGVYSLQSATAPGGAGAENYLELERPLLPRDEPREERRRDGDLDADRPRPRPLDARPAVEPRRLE